jgi:Fic family protein
MKIPQSPPNLHKLVLSDPNLLEKLSRLLSEGAEDRYLHWDELRFRTPPEGLTHEEWWAAVKLRRNLKPFPLKDKAGREFRFMVPETVAQQLHFFDMGAGGRIGIESPVLNRESRDRYVVSSLIREAITSSQLEGAVTTREVAKEMLRSGRKPSDRSERMILNNFMTMRAISELRDENLTPELVFDIHRQVTRDTLDNPDAAGRFRRTGEDVRVEDQYGQVFHYPPDAEELNERMEAMCAFANAREPFIHPVVRAILLHFWLGYDHPFVDGNGRTARGLFYWAMLHAGYWLFEFVSISDILLKAPVKYYRAFLYSETDDNDATYFLMHQTEVIRRAIQSLHEYIDHKTKETEESQSLLRAQAHLNHRQLALLSHAMRHPGHLYTVDSHQISHNTAYDTARRDLLALEEEGLLIKGKRGRALVFSASPNLLSHLRSRSTH